MRRPWLKSLLSLAALLTLGACVRRSAPGDFAAPVELALTSCALPRVSVPVRCGDLSVHEDRAAKQGRLIPIHVAVVPASGPLPHREPVFVIVGGPGQSAVENVASYTRLLGPLTASRDLVFVDQRGTGGSNALKCDIYGLTRAGLLGDFLPLDAVRACRDRLVARADLTQYNTAAAVRDLDDVRRALGYHAINIEAASYGTRVALLYLRYFGEHVRSAVLRSVSPSTMRQPLSFDADAGAALDSLIVDCTREPACAARFPHFQRDVSAVLERLAHAVPETEPRVSPSDDGAASRTLRLRRGPVAEKIRLMLYAPEIASYLPLVFEHAAADDYEPFATVAAEITRSISDQLAIGLYLSVTCAEDVAQITEAMKAATPPEGFLGHYRLDQQRTACAEWPTAPLPPRYAQAVQSQVPVLIVSSDVDPITPPRWGIEAGSGLPNSVHVVVRRRGHSPSSACVMSLATSFIEHPDPRALDTGCTLAERGRPPFATEVPD